MTKTELVEALRAKTGLTKKDVNTVVDNAIDVIIETLIKGDKVSLVGFGTFSVSNRNPRTAQNPRTGEKIEIPARKVPKFTPGKSFKERIDQ